MESKKINQLATEMSPASSDLTIIGDPITGVSKKVTLEQISSLFASSISFYTNYASFPATGSIDTLYCAKDTNKLYIWSGSAYVETFPSQALLDTYQLRSEKGNANGYASLDGSGKVPSTQLPSYVDDIIEVANYASLPVTGETGKIYITLDNNKIYRWSGSVYVEIASNNAIWGSITGTLSNQTDLQNALNAKVPTTRTLTIDGTAYDLSADRTWNILPTGGADGQILAKASATNYDTEWIDNYTSTVKHYVKLSENMTIGTAAYIDDASGTNMIAAKASYDAESTSAQTMGLIGQTGITNDIVFLITEGLLSGVNTSTATIGDPVYLGLNGALIFGVANKPSAPNNLVYLGVVTRVSSTVGEIFVKVQNGYELQELHNVAISSVANNQGLFYESSTSLWKNKSIATVLGYTPISLTSLSASSPLSYNNTTGAFSISQASGSVNGFLSSTDWTTFNNKQNALTNPITGTGASGQIAYFNGTTTQTGSAFLTWDNTDGILSTNSIYNFNNTTNAYMLSSNGENIGSIFNVASAKWSLGYGTSTTALGTPALTWDTSGRVGIGTTSPTTRLHVAGDIQSTTGVFLANTGGYFMTLNTLNGMYIDSTNYLTLNTNGLERARINTNGTFSIGNTNNTYNLDVTGTGRFTGALTGTSASFSSNVAVGTASAGSNVNVYSSSYGANGLFQAFGTDNAMKLQMGALGNSEAYIYANTGCKLSLFSGGNTTMTLASGGNVGIGTSSPTSAKLQVSGSNSQIIGYFYNNSGSTGNVPGVIIEAGTNSSDYSLDARSSTGTSLLKVLGNGNVGIGTTTPSGKLSLYDTADLWINIARGTSFVNIGVDSTGTFYNTNSNHRWLYNSGSNEGMRITSTGNVGIGTTSPAAKLDISAAENGNAIALAGWTINKWSGGEIRFGGVNASEWSILSLYTSGSEKLRITSAGNVGIGTTSPSFKLDVQGGSIVNGNGTIQTALTYATMGIVGTLSNHDLAVYANNAERMRIASGGNVGIGVSSPSYLLHVGGNAFAQNWFTPSDYRLKQDLKQFNGLDLVSVIKTYDYEWKSDNTRMYGVLSHELKEVLPYAVVGEKDGEQMQGVDYSKIVPVLIKAIQELKAEIDELKNK